MSSLPMLAHHGTNISYDRTKPITVKATVTAFRYANPHPQLFFDVTDDSGKVTPWGAEIASTPYTLGLNGWTRPRSTDALKPGSKITLTLAPSRAGTPVGLVLKILDDKGQEILTGSDDAGR
jgi:hypothetical protein